MSPFDVLTEVESDLAALTSLPGEIRAKVEAGVAELTRIRDAVDARIAAVTKSARSALASLEARAADLSVGGAGSPRGTHAAAAAEPGTDPAGPEAAEPASEQAKA